MRDLYTRDGEIFLVLFSLIDQSSLTAVDEILESIEKVRDGKPYALVLVGS